MTVKAWLTGAPSDLDTLAEKFHTGEPSVVRNDDGTYYLTSPTLDALFGQGGDLHDAASLLLDRLNGLARVLVDTHRPVELTGQFHRSGQNLTVVRVPSIESTLRVGTPTVTGGVPGPQRPSPTYFARLADQNTDVAEALDILGKSRDFSWDDLYKIYEIVRENVGGTNKGRAKQILIGKNWLSQTEIEAFDDSANTKAISGPTARHARGQAKTQHSMTLEEGRSAIRTLVQHWLDDLSAP